MALHCSTQQHRLTLGGLWLLLAIPALADAPLASDPAETDSTEEEAGPAAPAPRSPQAPALAEHLDLGRTPSELIEAATESRNAPLPERMKAITEPMMGLPYLIDPLGEGAGLDPDPYVRHDGYDCLTFVEEVLALALSGDPEQAGPIRMDLRYQSTRADPPVYGDRSHFMELQWLPDNVSQGYLRDTTADYGEVVEFQNNVTDGTWKAWGRRSLFQLTDEELPKGTMTLNVLPLATAKAQLANIRPGSIVLTVREHRSWIPIWITHLGLIVPAETPTFRHASKMKKSMKVRDNSLEGYLGLLDQYKNWKTAGIAIFEPVEQGPRLSALPPDVRARIDAQEAERAH